MLRSGFSLGGKGSSIVKDPAELDRMAFRWLGGQATRGGSGDVALSAPWGVVRQSAPQTAQGNLRGAYRLDPAGLLRFVRA